MGEVPPYLVLLRVGFALPAALLPRRCALTAPFHPYPGVAARAVYFLWHFPSSGLESTLPDVIRHTALRSSDFPLSSLTNKSGHPAQLPTIHYMRAGKCNLYSANLMDQSQYHTACQSQARSDEESGVSRTLAESEPSQDYEQTRRAYGESSSAKIMEFPKMGTASRSKCSSDPRTA